MIIQCPECDLQVSDKAISCPHCGYPLKPEKIPKQTKRRKRLPNGFGQISEIKGKNLRKPFRALVNVGTNPYTGRPISKPLKPCAYFTTYNEAYSALVEYNKNPYDVSDSITFEEVYKRWLKTKENTSSIRIWKSVWKYCGMLYKTPIRDIRVRHMKQCIDNGYILFDGKEKYMSPSIKIYVKMMFGMMFDYAIEYELTDRNYAKDFSIKAAQKEKETIRTSHIPYTEDELAIMWDNVEQPYVDMILIQCYSGWRPQELCNLEVSNISLDDRTFIGGMKTEAGTNRVVPIHSKIYPLVKSRYEDAIAKNSRYLFNDHRWISVTRFKKPYMNVIQSLGLSDRHRPHDGRVTFVTMAKNSNVDEYAIKYMVGHTISDITEKIYTKRSDEWLKNEIEKIK